MNPTMQASLTRSRASLSPKLTLNPALLQSSATVAPELLEPSKPEDTVDAAPAEAPEQASSAPKDARAENARAAVLKIAARYGADNVVDTAAEGADALDHLENLATFAAAFAKLPAEEVEAVFGELVKMLQNLPDTELGAVVAAAALSAMAQVFEANPELAAQMSDGLRAHLGELALAVDEAAAGQASSYAQLLESADEIENGGAGRSGDIDFSRSREATASANLRRVLGDAYVAPQPRAAAPAPASTNPVANDAVQALKERLMANPQFAALIAIIQHAMSQKDAARGLLSSSDTLDEQQMAFYTQANKEADQLLQMVTNTQKSYNDSADNFVRNV